MPTVDIGPEVFDVFADVDQADTYLAGDVLRAPGWALQLAPDAKERGLVSATRMLLELPWCDAVPDFDTAPEVVQQVTAMLAADLLAKPKLFADATGDSNVKSARGGSAQVEFFRPTEGGPAIPAQAWNMLVRAGLVGCVEEGDTGGPYVSGICAGLRPLGGRYPWDWPIAERDYD